MGVFSEDPGELFATAVSLDRAKSARLKEILRREKGITSLAGCLRYITAEYLRVHDTQAASTEEAA